MPSTLSEAHAALHARMRLAFDAATRAGLPGRFDVVEHGGLSATLTTATGLEFLNVVASVSPATVDALPDLLARYRAVGAPSPSVLAGDDVVAERLRALGYAPDGLRPMAVLDLTSGSVTGAEDVDGVTVHDADYPAGRALFLDVLAAGYDAPPVVGAFMAAEHGDPAVRGVIARRDGRPVAAAATTVHDDVAVLGGATVLPGERGRGYQSLLLAHRVRTARDAGCVAAVATAAPGSPSAANLARVGFAMVDRRRWVVVDQAVSST